jgi:tRNA(Ile)-lysidine synthase
MLPAALVERFVKDLDAIAAPSFRLGLAISGGPDSLALLALAAAARPSTIEAATVDHGLRSEAAAEAAMVAALCDQISVPHATLNVRWRDPPATAIQERARRERYRLLGYWAEEQGLDAIVTGHHADDQAETLLMRLARGAGVRGLAGMRPHSVVPGTQVRLLRPLLTWRRSELEQVCATRQLTPADDPSNNDERFERVRIRKALAETDWLDPSAVARSASHLADADLGLDWAMRREWSQSVRESRGGITYRPGDAPAEIRRRIVARALRRLATEGGAESRGAEFDHLLEALALGRTATLRGVRCQGGREWHFSPAAPRRT